MCHLSAGKGGPSETGRTSTAIRGSNVDMGEHIHELYRGVTNVTEGSRLYLGNCGPFDQSGSFSTRKDRLHYETVCPDFYFRNSETSWSAPKYRV